MNVKRYARGPLFWVLIVVLLLVLLRGLWSGGSDYKSVDTSQVTTEINTGNVKSVTFHDKEQTVQIETKDGKKLSTSIGVDQELVLQNKLDELAQKNGWFVPTTTLLDYLQQSRGTDTVLTPEDQRVLEWRWLRQKLLHGVS